MQSTHILDRKEQQIHATLCALFDLTASSIEQAVGYLQACDAAQAEQVMANGVQIGEMQRLLEQDCLIAIASQQPITRNLGNIIGALRIAGELERIGDYAGNIVANARHIGMEQLESLGSATIQGIAQICLRLLQEVRTAFVERDAIKASAASTGDEALAAALRQHLHEITQRMGKATELIDSGVRLLWIGHSLERAADRIGKIAEQVLYMLTAEEADLISGP
jgi:phosphate transport system protein